MALSLKELLAEVQKQDQQVGAAAARFRADLQRTYKAMLAALEVFLRNPDNFSPEEVYDLAAATKTLTQLDDILKEEGLGQLVQTYRSAFTPLTKQALSYFRKQGIPDNKVLAGISVDSLNAWVKFSEGRLRDQLDRQMVAPVRQAVFNAATGVRTVSEAAASVVAVTEQVKLGQTEALVQDAYRQYQRAVTVERADALEMEIFQYIGPDDSITSEQCKFLLDIDDHGVPGMLPKDEISADLHENLRDDPLIAGGHPNCRHKYMPLSLETALEEGYVP